ncbi:hypothetical protein V1509DRAFT_640051 [Lipomyces kononenkoae]
MRLYIPKPVPTYNPNDEDEDDRTLHTDRSDPAKMRATALDRAIKKPSNMMLLTFTGLVVAAFSVVTFFGKLPTLAGPSDDGDNQDEQQADEANEETEGGQDSKPSQKQTAE